MNGEYLSDSHTLFTSRFFYWIDSTFGSLFVDYIDCEDLYAFLHTSISLLVVCLAFWSVLHQIVYHLVSSPLVSKVSRVENKRRINILEPKDRLKFHTALWKAVNYSILSVVGLLVVWNAAIEYPDLGESGKAWIYEYTKYCIPTSPIPILMVLHYQLTISSYIYGTYTLLFVEHRLKDFWQMLTHHIITLCLTIGSYYIGHSSRGGCIVMILHDLCDPFMEIAKCFNYLKYKRMADILFALFALVFITLRCILYPFLVVSPFYTTNNFDFVQGGTIFGYMLTIILVLDIFWASLIVRMIIRQLAQGTVGEDIRERSD